VDGGGRRSYYKQHVTNEGMSLMSILLYLEIVYCIKDPGLEAFADWLELFILPCGLPRTHRVAVKSQVAVRYRPERERD